MFELDAMLDPFPDDDDDKVVITGGTSQFAQNSRDTFFDKVFSGDSHKTGHGFTMADFDEALAFRRSTAFRLANPNDFVIRTGNGYEIRLRETGPQIAIKLQSLKDVGF